MKLFYTGPFINAEMLVLMLEKHDIPATFDFVDPAPAAGDDEFNRPTRVWVPESLYEKAFLLFYAERQDEL